MKKILCIVVLLSLNYTAITLCARNSTDNDEFKLALKYFEEKGDSLQIKALHFLLDNVDIHYSQTYYWQDSLKTRFPFNEQEYADYNSSKVALKSLIEKQKLVPIPENIPDKKYLNHTMLIEIIENGFELWKKPWNKQLSFDDFCDYLLAYRVQNEPLEDWYESYQKRFSNLAKTTPFDICNSVNGNLKQWFFSSFAFEDKISAQYRLSPSQMLFRKQGDCLDMCSLSVYVMRSLGLACSIDFTPSWATSSYSHAWCSFIDQENEHRPFEGVTGFASDFVVYREPSKVFRVTYRKQPNSLPFILNTNEIPPGHLRQTNIIDVTDKYWRTTSITCKLHTLPHNQISYISVFNSLSWRPVDWGKVNNHEAKFKNISVGAIYLPMNYENQKLIPAGYPVLVSKDKKTLELQPDFNKKITITITEAPKYLYYRIGKKYRFMYWDNRWVDGGVKTATESKVLSFENIPSNTIYLLIPEYSELKERIFTVNDRGEIERW